MMVDMPDKTVDSNGHPMLAVTDDTGSQFGVRKWNEGELLVSTMDEDGSCAWNVALNKEQAMQAALLLLTLARELED